MKPIDDLNNTVAHLETLSEDGHRAAFYLDQSQNIEHLKTINSDDLTDIQAVISFIDARDASIKQRHLFFALRDDICTSTGNSPIAVKEELYDRYFDKYDKPISLSNEAQPSVTDANNLLAIAIDFCFEYNIEFKKGYELLPKNESYFLYACCKWRRCFECGKHADIDHLDEIGMGMDRTKVDHSQRHVISLCRIHHTERHKIGNTAFSKKYHLPLTGIKLSVETLKKMHIRGDYEEEEHENTELGSS